MQEVPEIFAVRAFAEIKCLAFRIHLNPNLHRSGVDTEVLTVTFKRNKGDEQFQVRNNLKVHFQIRNLNRFFIFWKENHGVSSVQGLFSSGLYFYGAQL